MATLKTLKTPEGKRAACNEVADFYAKGLRVWEETSMNKGLKNADEIVAEFKKHKPESTNAAVLLEDAAKY